MAHQVINYQIVQIGERHRYSYDHLIYQDPKYESTAVGASRDKLLFVICVAIQTTLLLPHLVICMVKVVMVEMMVKVNMEMMVMGVMVMVVMVKVEIVVMVKVVWS